MGRSKGGSHASRTSWPLVVLQAAFAGHCGGRSRRKRPETASQLEEIVVTARRTEESLQRVPFPCPRSAGKISRSARSKVSPPSARPSRTFCSASAAPRGAARRVVYIRGVGQADVRPTYDPAVGVYVDGVFLGRMQGNNLDTMDVERAGSPARPAGHPVRQEHQRRRGEHRHAPAGPPRTSRGKVQLTGGSRSRFDALGSLNVPLVDGQGCAARRCVRGRTQDGYGTRADGQEHGRHRSHIRHGSHCVCKPPDDFSALFAADARDVRSRRIPSSSSSPSIRLRRRSRPINRFHARFRTTSAGSSHERLLQLRRRTELEPRRPLRCFAHPQLRARRGATLKSISAYRDNIGPQRPGCGPVAHHHPR